MTGGPAHAAGLREGMPLLGWSVYDGDRRRDVELRVGPADGRPGAPTDLRYRPVDGSAESLPVARVRADAATSAAWHGWWRR